MKLWQSEFEFWVGVFAVGGTTLTILVSGLYVLIPILIGGK